MNSRLEPLFDVLESQDESSHSYGLALSELEALAHAGSAEAAEGIAEVFAFSERHRDPAKAYLWYHVALVTQGYLALFANQHATLEQYCGPVGDFRNEAQVNGLLVELGESRIRELDAAASEWLAEHRAI